MGYAVKAFRKIELTSRQLFCFYLAAFTNNCWNPLCLVFDQILWFYYFWKSIQNTSRSVVCVSMLVSTTLVNRCNWAAFSRWGEVLVLKQELMISVRGSTKKLPAVLFSFGDIWSSPMTLFMLMRDINFNTSVAETSEKGNHFACLECLILKWYFVFF